jgi:hypothetical protein
MRRVAKIVPLRAVGRGTVRSQGTRASSRLLSKALTQRAAPQFQAAPLQNTRLAGFTTATEVSEPSASALRASASRLHDVFFGPEATAEIATKADAPVDGAAALARLKKELAAGEDELDVFALGDKLTADGRRQLSVPAPVGLGGKPSARNIKMVLPNADDISRIISKRREEKMRVEKPDELLEILDKFFEKFMAKSADHVALLAAWGPKALGDAEGEFAEIAALMAQSLGAYRAGLKAAKDDFQFEVQRVGDDRDCLVMPPSNFALLGLKDAVHELLKGYRILLICQPRFLPQFLEVQQDLADCGLPKGLFEVLPGITPDADPDVLHEALRLVDRLQFTGSSAMFKSLVAKAYDLGNLRLEHGGEVSGLNKVRLDGVSATHPAALAGTAWAAMANNGELCTSASLVEFDPATGDTADIVKKSLEGHSFKFGAEIEDPSLNVLLKPGKTQALEVKTEAPDGLQEWWEKKILAVPQGGSPNTRTNQSLGHCVYAPSIDRAVELGLAEEASCIYMVGVPEGSASGAPSARAGTTGCKLPESVFGAMKTYTFAVAGDHDGVGSLQTLLQTVKRRGASWRDQEETKALYEQTEVAEMLTEFLNPKDQASFPQQISNVLEIFAAFEPKVGAPYNGQSLVGADGSSQLVSLKALRPTRKSLLIPKGVGLPEDFVKVALLCEMSPLKEIPVDLHLMDAPRDGKLRVTDPMKSFLRVVQKRLKWNVHFHADEQSFAALLRAGDYPPYFYCIKDKHLLPLDVLKAVAEKGGYFYEGMPTDALSLFRMMTTTQAWTVSCTESQVKEATAALEKAWTAVGLRDEPHPMPELEKPTRRDADIGGGFNAGGFNADDDKDWAELSSDDESSDSDEEAKSETPAKSEEAPTPAEDAKSETPGKSESEGKAK